MSLIHFQRTYCYCCQCRKSICIDEVKIREGNDFLKVDPLNYDWSSFILNGKKHYLCPKHSLEVNISVDGEKYYD